MRGVHRSYSHLLTTDEGSSPHARGPRFLLHPFPGISRIIPACAGSTIYYVTWSSNTEDHPRMRGVHFHCAAELLPLIGSSPHARGPQHRIILLRTACRIIPACAGSTNRGPERKSRWQDHPRMRGVHTKKMPKIRHFSWRYDPISFNFKNTCCVKMQSSKARCFCSSSPKCSARVFNL